MTEAQAKYTIEGYEYVQNSFSKPSGYSVKAVNLKKFKKGWKADIILVLDSDGQTEQYNDCEYPEKLFTQDLTNQE